MARSTDIIILGSGIRGLWLASELVKLRWKVTWVQLHGPKTNKQKGFHFDDWPLQVGPFRAKSNLIPLAREFIDDVIKPRTQEIAVQVVTPQGPLELSGGGEGGALKKFFPKSWESLRTYLSSLQQSRGMDEPGRGQKFLFAHTKKIFERPLGERWILEWLGSLRRSRAVSTKDWILTWFQDVLDPQESLWLLNDGMEDVCARGMEWARKKGVDVRERDVVADVGIEGNEAKGIEVLGGEGFLEAKNIVVACSHQRILGKLPTLGKKLQNPLKANSEKWVWIRCGFLLKSASKPAGLLEFSSFVLDPHMPLVEGNMGLLKWSVAEKNDHLTVWVRVPYGELKRRSYLMALTEGLQRSLGNLFPWFDKNLVAVLPFEEYFHSPEVGHDDLAIVFNEDNAFVPFKSKMKNVWMMEPCQDRGLEILSSLATEYRLLNELSILRQKELRKSDRKIHPARDGQGLVHTK